MIALHCLPGVFRAKFARLVAYRAEMAIWIFTALLPLVMLALWNSVTVEQSIGKFGQEEVARYFVATLIVRQLTGAWVIWQLNFDIRSGALSSQLLRPVNPLVVYAIWMLAAMPLRLLFLSPLVMVLAAWRPELLLMPSVDGLALFLISVGLAWGIAFLAQAIFGILAFWLDRTEGLFGVWLAIWLVFSGYIAPLSFFPEAAQDVLRWLPFRSMLAVPVEILGGFLPYDAAVGDVGIQLMWLLILLFLTSLLWKKGLQRYGAFGA